MNNQMNSNLFIRSSLALALTLAIWAPVQVRSAEPAEKKDMTEEHMIARCQEMMEHKRDMKEAMKAQDAELTELLAKMNSAPEDKKMNLMAAVITRVVEQRITRDARKAKMEEAMMQHMMRRMQVDKESMSQCPMMKGMEGVEEHTGRAHNRHQEGQQ